MPTHTSRVTHATSEDSFSQTINQAVEVVLPPVTPLLPAQVLCFTPTPRSPDECDVAAATWRMMRERPFRAAGGINILLERSWTVGTYSLWPRLVSCLMSCWDLSLPIKQLFTL